MDQIKNKSRKCSISVHRWFFAWAKKPRKKKTKSNWKYKSEIDFACNRIAAKIFFCVRYCRHRRVSRHTNTHTQAHYLLLPALLLLWLWSSFSNASCNIPNSHICWIWLNAFGHKIIIISRFLLCALNDAIDAPQPPPLLSAPMQIYLSLSVKEMILICNSCARHAIATVP